MVRDSHNDFRRYVRGFAQVAVEELDADGEGVAAALAYEAARTAVVSDTSEEDFLKGCREAYAHFQGLAAAENDGGEISGT